MAFDSTGITSTLEQAVSLHQSGQLEGAEHLYRSILEIDPENADANHLLGVVALDSGDPERGKSLIENALDRDPDNAHYHNNLGLCFRQLNRREECIVSLEKAISLKPDYVDAHNNLACVLAGTGRFSEAAERFEKLLKIRPYDADTLENSSKALIRCRRLDEAEERLLRLVELKPESANALSLLGGVYRDRNDPAAAFNMQWRAIQAEPENTALWVSFASTFAKLELGGIANEQQLRDILLACLLKDGIDHESLAKGGRQILLRDALIRSLVDSSCDDDTTAVYRELSDAANLEKLSDRLFLTALERISVPEVGFERFLTKLRSYMLSVAVDADSCDHWLVDNPALVFALAKQCFRNGYVFEETPIEETQFNQLVSGFLEHPFENTAINRFKVGVVACYVRLVDWEIAAEIVDSIQPETDQGFLSLLIRQVQEPFVEQQLRPQIPVFGTVRDEVSTKVQAQYEEHPYPKWTSYNEVQAKTVSEVIRDLFPDFDLDRLATADPPKILVAGCGSGKQLMLARARFKDAEIVGMDLSLSSLAYALRKMRESGVDDIAVMQGDILSLDSWSEPMDVVECVGVLHHMDDPIAGWRILTEILKPGGVMKIGLYSSLAREEIVKVRDFIAKNGYECTEEDIRRGRQDIIEHLSYGPGRHLLQSPDFHSLNGTRDLFFHVQEHRFTLPQLADSIEDLGLEFIGFELANWKTAVAFKDRFPEPNSANSLDAWHSFELENPYAFAGMYQFWLSKPAAH